MHFFLHSCISSLLYTVHFPSVTKGVILLLPSAHFLPHQSVSLGGGRIVTGEIIIAASKNWHSRSACHVLGPLRAGIMAVVSHLRWMLGTSLNKHF